jgi:hypothetical protein
MVVFKIDIQGILARPAESDSKIPGNAHRKTLRAAMQQL